jgi:hypothetical protein
MNMVIMMTTLGFGRNPTSSRQRYILKGCVLVTKIPSGCGYIIGWIAVL